MNASAQPAQTIKFALAFHDVQLDLGMKGPSVGDEPIFADSLLDAQGRKVGHYAGVCTLATPIPPEAACQITFFLPQGEIAMQFLNARPPRRVAAIVGTGVRRARRRGHCRRSQADGHDYLSADTLTETDRPASKWSDRSPG